MAASNPLILVPTFQFDSVPSERVGVTWSEYGLTRIPVLRAVPLAKRASVPGELRQLADRRRGEIESQLGSFAPELDVNRSAESFVYGAEPVAPLLAALPDLALAEQVFRETREYEDRGAVTEHVGRSLANSYKLVSPWEQRVLRRQAARLLYSNQFTHRDMGLNEVLLTEMLEWHPGYAASPGEFAEDWLTAVAIHHALNGDSLEPDRMPVGQSELFAGLGALFEGDRDAAIGWFDEYWERHEQAPTASNERGTSRFGVSKASPPTFALPADLQPALERALGLAPYHWPSAGQPTWPSAEAWNVEIPQPPDWAWNREHGVVRAEEAEELAREAELAREEVVVTGPGEEIDVTDAVGAVSSEPGVAASTPDLEPIADPAPFPTPEGDAETAAAQAPTVPALVEPTPTVSARLEPGATMAAAVPEPVVVEAKSRKRKRARATDAEPAAQTEEAPPADPAPTDPGPLSRGEYKARLREASKLPGPVADPGLDLDSGPIALLIPLTQPGFETFTDEVPSAPSLPAEGESWETALRITGGGAEIGDTEGEVWEQAALRAAANVVEFREQIDGELPVYTLTIDSGRPTTTAQRAAIKAAFDLQVLAAASLREDKHSARWDGPLTQTLASVRGDEAPEQILAPFLGAAATSYPLVTGSDYVLGGGRRISMSAAITETLGRYQDEENFPAIVRANGKLLNQVVSTSLRDLPTNPTPVRATAELEALCGLLAKAGCDVEPHLAAARIKQERKFHKLPPLVDPPVTFDLEPGTPLLFPISPDVVAVATDPARRVRPDVQRPTSGPVWEAALRLTGSVAMPPDIQNQQWEAAVLAANGNLAEFPPILDASSPLYQVRLGEGAGHDVAFRALLKAEFDMMVLHGADRKMSRDSLECSRGLGNAARNNHPDTSKMLGAGLRFAATRYGKWSKTSYPMPDGTTVSLRKVVTDTLRPFQDQPELTRVLETNGYLVNEVIANTLRGLTGSSEEAARELHDLLDLVEKAGYEVSDYREAANQALTPSTAPPKTTPVRPKRVQPPRKKRAKGK